MSCDPGVVKVDGPFVFPFHSKGTPYDPVDVPIHACGLQNLDPAGGKIALTIRPWGVPDENFVWHYNDWWVGRTYTVSYTGRDETHILGVTRYPSHGRCEDFAVGETGYYNPNAYWTPPAPGDPPPVGGDPDAGVGQDPATLDPPTSHLFRNRPYRYATMKTYDLMGVNRTGLDLAPIYDPDDPETLTGYGDPYDDAHAVLKFVYDDQDPDGSTVKDIDWEPDGENVRNQSVALFSANQEGARQIRKIGRNVHSRKQIGTYGAWDPIGFGGDVTDVSEQNVAAHAQADVEAYGWPPNHFTIYLLLEPADGTPARGDGPEPAAGWLPQYRRDFKHGDRVIARMRKGYIDTGEIPVRIMHVKVAQADASNNVQVTIDVVPVVGDLFEVEVI